ncbi:MAG TPA: hypothetical protein GXX19_10730 [Syntrophomonadaceae bacterium]|nr:hypothetical protein [Syntrophomonadaceae bacterium]
MCGDGNTPIPPPDGGSPCPKEIITEINDILHSGNIDIWEKEVTEGSIFTLEIDPDDQTIIIKFEDKPIGRLFNRNLYKCIKEREYSYNAVLLDKESAKIRVYRC